MSDNNSSGEEDVPSSNENSDSSEEEEETEFLYFEDPSEREFCIVKLKEDLEIQWNRDFRVLCRHGSSCPRPSPPNPGPEGVVYFKYDEDSNESDAVFYTDINFVGRFPKKYFFLPKSRIEDKSETRVSSLFTGFYLEMQLSKKIIVEKVKPEEYETVFKKEPNLFLHFMKWGASRHVSIFRMFSGKDQVEQFYTTVVEANRNYLTNYIESGNLFGFADTVIDASKLSENEDTFALEHLEAFSSAMLHMLKTSSYVYEEDVVYLEDGRIQEAFFHERRRRNTLYHSPADPSRMPSLLHDMEKDYGEYPKYPAVFEELKAELCNLNLNRQVYYQYVWSIYESPFSSDNFIPLSWNHSHFSWVMLEILKEYIRKPVNLSSYKVKTFTRVLIFILLQPPFWILLKDEAVRQNFLYFLNKKYFPVVETIEKVQVEANMLKKMFTGEFDQLPWERIFTNGPNRNNLELKFGGSPYYSYPSYLDTAGMIAQLLALYPERRGGQSGKSAEFLLETLKSHGFFNVDSNCEREYLLGTPQEDDKAIHVEMKQILLDSIKDVSADLPLAKVYDLYKKSRLNPSPGLLWLAIAHRQAVGTLGDLEEEQQRQCFEILESALNYFHLQTVEVFFRVIQGFRTRTSDTPPTEKEQKIAKYIEKRRTEEAEIMLLLHLGIEEMAPNEKIERYEKNHKNSVAFFVFMSCIKFNRIMRQESQEKIIDYYVLNFTKYLINNPKVMEFFKKRKQLADAVKEYITRSLESGKYTQLTDLLTLDWMAYFNKWIVLKSVIGQYNYGTIKQLRTIGSGVTGAVYVCDVEDFVNPVVYKGFEDGIDSDIVAELNVLMKLQSHPNIVRIFGIVMKNTTPSGLMEHCKGGSLQDVISGKGYIFEEKTTFHWMAQAASGLKFLHANTIAHLDIKPANMLLSKNHRLLKLSDMGITKIGKKDANFRASGEFGTPGYRAWEIEGGTSFSHSVDIFSLGRCLWSLFFKDHPDHQKVFQSVVALDRSIFEETADSKEDLKAMEELTKKAEKRDEAAGNEARNHAGAECPPHVRKLIIRMTAVNCSLRPTAEDAYAELKERYEKALEEVHCKEVDDRV